MSLKPEGLTLGLALGVVEALVVGVHAPVKSADFNGIGAVAEWLDAHAPIAYV